MDSLILSPSCVTTGRLFLVTLVTMILPLSICSFSMLRLASWNLLAQDYAKEYKYPWIQETPGCLEWNHRKSLITEVLKSQMKADIVCLQEAQVDLFSDLLNSLSSTYDGVIQNVTRGHNVGTAMLIRKSSSVRIKRVESRSRALIVTLQDKENCAAIMYVCSVHLDADRSTDSQRREHHQKQRQSQLKSLLKRINFACKLDKQVIKEAPILIAGDFNMLRENPLHKSLVEGSLTTSPNAFVTLYDAYLQAERHKRYSTPAYCDELQHGSKKKLKTPNKDQHLVKTYKGGAILDYIYTSEKVKVIDTLLYHPKSSTKGIEFWPNEKHPSDHLPIGIDFEWN